MLLALLLAQMDTHTCLELERVISLGEFDAMSSLLCKATDKAEADMELVFDSPVADIIFMGYADSAQVGTGLRQRIYSRAFIVGDVNKPKDRVLYLVLDIQSGDTAVRDGIIKGLAKMGPEYAVYTKDNVAVTGTHSHSGPGAWTNYFLHHASTSGFDKPSWEAVVQGALLSIKKAHESMKEGRINWGKIRLEGANANRSPTSYDANPEDERKQYGDNVDKDLTLLRFSDLNNKDIGMLSFFATHGTSLQQNNTLVTGDNKGVAAYLMEKKMQANSPGYVAGFSQANVGDVTPNINGDWCESGPDYGKRCKADDSTCGGTVGPCHSRGPFWGLNDAGTKSCFEVGKIQYEKAYELLQKLTSNSAGTEVRGPVRAFHTYQDMRFTKFPHPNGTTVQTCAAAMGYSFAAGTSDGPGIADFKQGLKGDQPAVSPIWPILSGLIKSPTPENKACHGIKPILLDIGEITFPYEWGPNQVDIQLMRVGPVIMIISTGEATTMAGRRWRGAIKKAAIDTALFKDHEATANAEPIVLLGGPSNSYTHYITTEEEYSQQRYEGASTLYGPHTLNGLIHFSTSNIKYLSASDVAGAIPAGVSPIINVDKAISLIASVPMDMVPSGKKFGDVLAQPKATYQKGEQVSVKFQGANPRNNLRLEGTFAAVQIQSGATAKSPSSPSLSSPPTSNATNTPASSSKSTRSTADSLGAHLSFSDEPSQNILPRAELAEWTTVRDDFDWELVLKWKKGSFFNTSSETTIIWETAPDTPSGTYRIVYNGDSKSFIGTVTPFQGISNSFTIA